MPLRILLFCLLSLAPPLTAQDQIRAILERLDRLEQENRALRAELDELRRRAGPPPPAAEPAPRLEERVEVQEARTAELAQTKVEASSRFPITITGMALFNAFSNTRNSAASQYPTSASASPTPASAGATFRQSILGFRFQGPTIAGGGRLSGSLYTDFWAGSDSSLNHLLRIRTATLEVDWKNTTILAGQEKPLISPREPTSIAQVGVSPLTSAGNPWLWQPQVRLERRLALGPNAGLRLQGALFQTAEARTTIPDEYTATVDPSRPGLQGRFELWRDFGRGRRIELAPGFHSAKSHVAGATVPSGIFSFDWMVRPLASLDFSGLYFAGRNIAPLGALRQGYQYIAGRMRPVHTRGGYGQLAWRPTARLSFHAFTGQQDDRNRDLLAGRTAKNLVFGANTLYRLAPNVIVSFEGSNIRTSYIGGAFRTVTHYDIAVAYLF